MSIASDTKLPSTVISWPCAHHAPNTVLIDSTEMHITITRAQFCPRKTNTASSRSIRSTAAPTLSTTHSAACHPSGVGSKPSRTAPVSDRSASHPAAMLARTTPPAMTRSSTRAAPAVTEAGRRMCGSRAIGFRSLAGGS